MIAADLLQYHHFLQTKDHLKRKNAERKTGSSAKIAQKLIKQRKRSNYGYILSLSIDVAISSLAVYQQRTLVYSDLRSNIPPIGRSNSSKRAKIVDYFPEYSAKALCSNAFAQRAHSTIVKHQHYIFVSPLCGRHARKPLVTTIGNLARASQSYGRLGKG